LHNSDKAEPLSERTVGAFWLQPAANNGKVSGTGTSYGYRLNLHHEGAIFANTSSKNIIANLQY
jgi:hypothetical protein